MTVSAWIFLPVKSSFCINHFNTHPTAGVVLDRPRQKICQLTTSLLLSTTTTTSIHHHETEEIHGRQQQQQQETNVNEPQSFQSEPAIIQQQELSSRTTIETNVTKKRRQRIAIVGSGAVGSYYGSRLWEIGHEVHFLFRNDNYDTVHKDGLHITSIFGNVHIGPQHILAHRTTTDMIHAVRQQQQPSNNSSDTTDTSPTDCSFDWVIVALKSSSLDAIPDLILPLLDPNKTRVLVIMNGMIENDLLHLMKIKTGQYKPQQQPLFPHGNSSYSNNEPLQCCHTWYGGMALICCNRIASCHVDHTYFGLLTAGVASTKETTNGLDDSSSSSISSGGDGGASFSSAVLDSTNNNTPSTNERAFRELFELSKIDVAYDPSLLRGRWNKMIWNLPFNGLSVAMGGITVDQIVNDAGLRQLAYNIMDETILVANTELRNQCGDKTTITTTSFVPLGDTERKAMMKLSDDMGPYKPSTMLDFIHRRSMEVQYLFRTPLNRAKQLNISTPYLETIVLQIEAYQRMYNLY